jgi:aldehyde:ferredoxin oxidoreductase
MSVPNGYAGKVAYIELTKQEIKVVPTDRFFKDYNIDPKLWIGGDGFIAKVLWKDITKAIDPLSPENEIVIATGPWTGTAAPQAGRAMLGCISPETTGYSSGSFGWYFPATLKYAGYDVVIIRGKSAKPTYIFIDDDEITFHDASKLWGKQTGETTKAVRTACGERFDSEIRVMTIAPAAENMVLYSPPCTDGTSCPGRSGGGTVMGSKNLKAIAVRGTGEISIYDPKGLIDASYRAVKKFEEEEPTLKIWKEEGGTTDLSVTAQWPMTGHNLGVNRGLADVPHLRNAGCLNCHAPCYHWLQLKGGKYNGLRQLGGHMTYITTSLRNLGFENFDDWIYYERLTQELGLDPASFSMAFSYAVDLFVKGILTTDSTDGLVMRRADPELVWEVARRVSYRQGKFGNLLADGVAKMAKALGPEAEAIMPQTVKDKPSIQRDSKLQALMWSFGALTNPRGGDWLRVHNVWELAFLPENRDTYPKYIGMTNMELYKICTERLDMPLELKKKIFGDPPVTDTNWVKNTNGKALFNVWTENFVALFNDLVTCMFGAATQFMMVGFGPTTYAENLNKITGWGVTYDDLMKVGERTLTLQRLFNYRIKGWDKKQDRFQDKAAYEPGSVGIYRSKIVPWEQILKEYYEIRGWTPQGIPTKAKLKELKMEDVATELKLTE